MLSLSYLRMRPPPVCHFFNGSVGSCHNGDSCPFVHQQMRAPPVYAHSSYSSSYQQKNSWTSSYDPNKYKYVAPKRQEEVLTKITRTISNEEPERSPSPKDIQIVVKIEESSTPKSSKLEPPHAKSEDLSSIYSNPSDLSSIDRSAFEAPSFTLGLIPLVAPSRDLC